MKFKYLSLLAATLVAFGGPALAENKTTGEHIDDSTITADVKARLVDAKGVPSGDVNVEVYKGIVLLSGFVTDAPAKAGAETAAKGAKGVAKVHNAITVHPKTSMGSKLDDTVLVGKVKAALVDEKHVDAGSINVESRDSIVQLGGFVSGKAEKDKALATAKGVKGVKSVVDALYVKP
jgi:hyperosmotically inducible periplasmic protein